MNRNIKLMAMAVSGLLLTSCSLEAYEEPAAETYTKDFVKTFGLIDKDQTWNTATRVTANVSLGSLDADTVSVYTAMPGTAFCRLVAKQSAAKSSFSFDYLQSSGNAYVIVTDNADNVLLENYFDINNGVMNVTTSATRGTRATDTSSPVTLGDVVDLETRYIGTPYDAILTDYMDNQYNPTVIFSKMFTLYKLNNMDQATSESSQWKISDLVGIVGTDGVFHEQVVSGQLCNLLKWESELKPSEGVTFTLTEDGPVSLDYIYGGTVKYNSFGYIYYTETGNETEDELKKKILEAPRYLLIEKAEPQSNVKADGEYVTGGMILPGLVQSYETSGADPVLTGTKYQLTYYGEDGTSEGSYTFPKGTRIIFFEVINGQTSGQLIGYNMRYSLPWINGIMGDNDDEENTHSTGAGSNAKEDFVTYKWGGKIVMGMEDEGGDHDMNDILFIVNGKFDEDIPDINPDPEPEPEAQSWSLACEDLGGTDDFDFNDVVFSVSYVSGQTTATITPLAAGGIYPAEILYNGENICTDSEVHHLLGSESTSVMLNTTTKGSAGTPVTITVPEDFTITDGMGQFSIRVTIAGSSTNEVTAPGKGDIPQMICVPGTWVWPTERTRISDAYPDFGTWGANYSYDGTWYENVVDEKIVH